MRATKKDLSVHKGDTCRYKLSIINSNGEILILDDGFELYFTVKRNFEERDYIFQKTINNGIVYNSENHSFEILINPEDTEKLHYQDYAYDILLVRNKERAGSAANQEEKTTLMIGRFTIDPVVTFAENEV